MEPKPFTIDDLLRVQRPTGLVPLHLSPDGSWLTLSSRPSYDDASTRGPWINEEVAGSDVLVVSTMTGETQRPFAAASSWGGQWSPDGRWLAAYAVEDGDPCLALWDVETGDSRLLSGVPAAPVFGLEVPQWMPDSHGVVLKLAPEELESRGESAPASEPAAQRTVLSFDPALNQGEDARAGEDRELACDLGMVDVETGGIRRLLKRAPLGGWRIAPDGHAVATLQRSVGSDWDRKWWNLVVCPLDGSPPRQIAADLQQSEWGCIFNWSPDGRQIAYVTLRDRSREGRLFVVAADGAAEPVELTGDAVLTLTSEGADMAAPCWSDDGKMIYYPAGGAVWAFSADGSSRQRFTAGGSYRLRYWLQRPLSGILSTLGDGAILTIARDPASKNEGIVRIDPTTGEATCLTEVAQSFGRGDDISKVEAASDGSCYYTLLEAANHPREVWRFRTESRRLERLATINPHLEGADLGSSRLIEYRTLDGETRRSALLLPAGYRDAERVPVVVQLYNGNYSNWIHYFGFGENGQFNGNLLANRGIAFLRPDLPLGHGDPLRQLPGLVLPAIHRLVELGIADPERIGLAGFSHGCYLTLGLLTQTTLFRAAVAIGGMVNVTSRYGALTDQGDSYGMTLCESRDAQGLGGSLWEKREAYVENSPLFYLDRVRTPVLLAAGTADTDDANQARQAFSTLRRLGQRVELRLYHGEDHFPGYWSLSNLRDLSDRVVSWFETHLCSRAEC